MANTSSAKKSALQSEKNRVQNLARRSALKTALKKVTTALEQQHEAHALKALLSDAASQLARAKGKHVIHKNTASRKLSRLARKVARALQSSPAEQQSR